MMKRLFSLALCACCLSAAPALGGETRVAVLGGGNSAPYRAALEGFLHRLAQAGHPVQVRTPPEGQGETEKFVASLDASGTDILFALGQRATAMAVVADRGVPVVGALFLRPDELLGRGNATGVSLEIPVDQQLKWLARILPDVRRPGVLYDPRVNDDKIRAATAAARRYGLSLQAFAVSHPREMPAGLKKLLQTADALWTIPDPTTLTSQTSRELLLLSFRNRLPFAGISENWVRAGALYALERDYTDIGRQAGDMALRILGGEKARNIPIQSPRKLKLFVNQKTKDSLDERVADIGTDIVTEIFR